MTSATPTAALGEVGEFVPRLGLRRLCGFLFAGVCLLFSLIAVAALIALMVYIIRSGSSVLSMQFLTNPASQLEPETSGLRTSLLGTLWLISLTAFCAVPIGVGAAVYLEEYATRNRFTEFVQINLANLAGVPSIVYGILGLAVFVRWLGYGRGILAGALTLTLLVLPVIVIASREALAAVPKTLREAAYAVGATRWQTVRHHVLPAALPGIMTGIILSLSRAIGETAPLLVIGAAAYVSTVPGGDLPQTWSGITPWIKGVLFSEFSALPVQVYDWSKAPDLIFQQLAAGAILVLLAVLLSLNAVAAGIRAWHQSRRIS